MSKQPSDPPDLDLCSNCGNQFPSGQLCDQCGGQGIPAAEVPGLEAILRASQGITPDVDGAIRAMASVHAQWKAAWLENGFTEQETFELVRILVASSAGGVRCLNL